MLPFEYNRQNYYKYDSIFIVISLVFFLHKVLLLVSSFKSGTPGSILVQSWVGSELNSLSCPDWSSGTAQSELGTVDYSLF